MKTKLDIIGIGNAMVDVIIPAKREYIEANGFTRDAMNLIAENKTKELHNLYEIKEMVGGGSVGNTMFGISSLGGNGTFVGKIKNDDIGQFLIKDMNDHGISFPLEYSKSKISTGCCTLFVEEDGTRTMATFLGAGTTIGPNDIYKKDIESHKISYLEGYLWDNDNAKKAIKKMIKISKNDGQKIALTLSDQFCIQRHRQSFNDLISKDIDILFANEDEICSLAQTNSLVNAIEYCKNLGILIAVTIGEKGSILIYSNKVIEIQAISVENVVDLTGAGDLYAAGFLFGLARNKTLEECGRYGSLASSEIISHFGARPFRNLSELI